MSARFVDVGRFVSGLALFLPSSVLPSSQTSVNPDIAVSVLSQRILTRAHCGSSLTDPAFVPALYLAISMTVQLRVGGFPRVHQLFQKDNTAKLMDLRTSFSRRLVFTLFSVSGAVDVANQLLV